MRFTRMTSLPRPIRSPRVWKPLMSTSPNAVRKSTIINRKNSPTPVLLSSSTRADLSRSYTGKSRVVAAGKFDIRRSEIMVEVFPKKILYVAVIAGLIALPLIAPAQDKSLKKISWGVTSLSASNWIPWIAKEAKIYEKNGLDVQLILVKGSGQTSTAILGGSLYAAPVALPTVMLADLSGADLVNIAHTVPGVQSKLLVKPEIKRPEDLKGKKIATSSLGSLGDFLFRYIIRKHGMDPARDVVWISIGTPPERLQALASGAVDAADLSYPTDAQGERMGFQALFVARKEVVSSDRKSTSLNYSDLVC